MKLSDAFYRLLNDAENLSELAEDDPKLIEIRKQVAFDLNTEYAGPKLKKDRVHNHTAGSVYDDTTLDNLTPMRYLYLVQHGVKKTILLAELGKRNQYIDTWLNEYKLIKSDQQYYELTYKKKTIDIEFDTLTDVADYLGKSKDYVSRFTKDDGMMPNGYSAKLVNRHEVTLFEALKPAELNTFNYWHMNRKFAKPKKRRRKYDKVEVGV